MLTVIMLSVAMLNVTNKPFLLSVIMPCVIMLSVVMLNVVAPLSEGELERKLVGLKSVHLLVRIAKKLCLDVKEEVS